MASLKARVTNGRLVLNEPTDLPDGTEVRLVIDTDGDDLDDEERAALYADLDESLADADAGKTRPAEEVLREIKSA